MVFYIGPHEKKALNEAVERIKPIFVWYDMWIGMYWDRKKRKLYVLLVSYRKNVTGVRG